MYTWLCHCQRTTLFPRELDGIHWKNQIMDAVFVEEATVALVARCHPFFSVCVSVSVPLLFTTLPLCLIHSHSHFLSLTHSHSHTHTHTHTHAHFYSRCDHIELPHSPVHHRGPHIHSHVQLQSLHLPPVGAPNRGKHFTDFETSYCPGIQRCLRCKSHRGQCRKHQRRRAVHLLCQNLQWSSCVTHCSSDVVRSRKDGYLCK